MASKVLKGSKNKKTASSKNDICVTNEDVHSYELTLSDSDTENVLNISDMKPKSIPSTIIENIPNKINDVILNTKVDTSSSDDELNIPETKLTSAMTIQSNMEDVSSGSGKWTSRLANNLDEVKTVNDILLFLADKNNYNMDDASITDIWDKLCSIPRDEMLKRYAKYNKRAVKEKAKFQSKDLVKPARCGRDIYLRELSLKNKTFTPPIKMSLKQQSENWQKLTPVQKDHYLQQSDNLKKEYNDAMLAQQKLAIEAGEFPEPEPKRYVQSYIRFRTDYLPKLKAKITKPDMDKIITGKTTEEQKAVIKKLRDEYNKKVETALKEKWEKLSVDKKKIYDDATAKDKLIYENDKNAWKKRCIDRESAQKATV